MKTQFEVQKKEAELKIKSEADKEKIATVNTEEKTPSSQASLF